MLPRISLLHLDDSFPLKDCTTHTSDWEFKGNGDVVVSRTGVSAGKSTLGNQLRFGRCSLSHPYSASPAFSIPASDRGGAAKNWGDRSSDPHPALPRSVHPEAFEP